MDSIDFIRKFPVRTFSKGETVLREGDVSRSLLAMREGYIKVTSLDNTGLQRLLWIAGRYDIVPTEQLFSLSSPIKFFYTALSDVSVYEIEKSEFLDFAKKSLPLMSEIATSMSLHYDDLLLRIQSVEQPSVREKLISTLLYLARRLSAAVAVDIYAEGLILTHQDLAEMIGTTRETASLELGKLRDKKCVDYDRTKFIIHTNICEELIVS